jgi:hypothetical protein
MRALGVTDRQLAQDADDVADELWSMHDAAHKNNVRGAVRRTDE